MFTRNTPHTPNALLVVATLFFGALFVSGRHGAVADNASPWLAPASPTFTKSFDLDAGEALPDMLSAGNRDCTRKTVTTRPATHVQTELKNEYCFVETPYGDIADGSYIHFNGTKVAGKIATYPGYLGTYGIPSSLDAFNLKSTALGRTFHLTKHVSRAVATETAFDGQITYRFKDQPDQALTNGNGTPFYVIPTSMSFSTDGQWMVTDTDSSIGMLRVNLETLQVLPFGHSSGSGVAPGVQTAVSHDGRYAVVTSVTGGVFKIYDLSTCDSSVPSVITGPVACQSRDLWTDAAGQIPGFKGPLRPKFTSGSDFLSFYTNIGQNGTIQYAKYNVYAPGVQPENLTYLAMGDSFASGEGDTEGNIYYEPGTDVEVNKCHLSTRSYPYLINEYLGLSDFHSVACSGAVEDNITLNAQENRKTPTPNPLGLWIPGVRAQSLYLPFANTPSFVTLSIGGNDIGFANKITECITWRFKLPLPSTCKYASDLAERSGVAEEIANQFFSLKQVYRGLAEKTGGKTKIYVIGYPQFIKGSGGSCGANVHLNDEERYFVEQATAYMNQVIKAAAASAGVHYVDVEDALEGHNLCSIVPDEDMAVNGVTLGNDIPNFLNGPIGNESYHPNPIGHKLLEEKILAQTDNNPIEYQTCPDNPGEAVCPSGSNHIPIPDVSYFGSTAIDYVEQINTLSRPNTYTVPTNQQLIVDSDSETGQLQLQKDLLLPGSQATLVIESNPTQIGTYTVDSSGVLDAQVTIPGEVEPGYHTLHLTGTNIAGEPVHYYEHIFVPGPEGDIDGNDVPDTEEACVFIQPSGQDQDVDGIDDACDGYMGPVPVPPTVTFLSPHDGDTIDGNTQISADVEDERGVASVQFQLDGNNISEAIAEAPYTASLDTTIISNGAHTLSITVTNVAGLTTTITEQINVYNLPPPPTIAITSPTNSSTVSGTVKVTADANDAEGVSGVQFRLDDENLGAEDTEKPYSYSWDTSSAQNGEHTLFASAKSLSGQTTTVSVTVNVQNSTEPLIIQFIKAILNYILSWFKRFF